VRELIGMQRRAIDPLKGKAYTSTVKAQPKVLTRVVGVDERAEIGLIRRSPHDP